MSFDVVDRVVGREVNGEVKLPKKVAGRDNDRRPTSKIHRQDFADPWTARLHSSPEAPYLLPL